MYRTDFLRQRRRRCLWNKIELLTVVDGVQRVSLAVSADLLSSSRVPCRIYLTAAAERAAILINGFRSALMYQCT